MKKFSSLRSQKCDFFKEFQQCDLGLALLYAVWQETWENLGKNLGYLVVNPLLGGGVLKSRKIMFATTTTSFLSFFPDLVKTNEGVETSAAARAWANLDPL